MTFVRFSLIAAVLIAAPGAALLFAPATKPTAPTLPIFERSEPREMKFGALSAAFDQGRLPEPEKPEPVVAPPPPPPDPAAGLKQYRFIGLAISEARGAGVFERNGETIVVTPGELLEGFFLKTVENNAAHFEDEAGNKVRLVLETAPNR